MSWRSIGEGESSPLTGLQYHPIVWPQRPVYNTYGAVLDALKSILQPINERLDPSYRLRQMQLAEYMSPQAAQLRQRTQALQAQALGLQGEKIGMEKELLPAEKARRQAMADATISGLKEGSGWHLGPDNKFHEDSLGDQIVNQRAKLGVGNQSSVGAIPQDQSTSLGNSQSIQIAPSNTIQGPTPKLPPPKTPAQQENDVTHTRVGMNAPDLRIAPDIMKDYVTPLDPNDPSTWTLQT